MKVNQLKTLIKEAVKEAIREELTQVSEAPAAPVQEVAKSTPPPPISPPIKTGDPIQDILNETKASMTSEDYRTVISGNSSMVSAGGTGLPQSAGGASQVGLDLSQLSFTKKAGAIYKKSNELDKNK
tara:strand:+ start:458 stop:838 length:381 start_codon:yes stop_codon:yes gene_type:complete